MVRPRRQAKHRTGQHSGSVLPSLGRRAGPEPGLAVRLSGYGHAVAEGGYGRGDLQEAVVLGHTFAAGRGTGLEVAAAGADG